MGVVLGEDEVRALRRLVPSLTATPSLESESAYDLSPGSTVGSVTINDLEVHIQPKIGVSRLLYLLSFGTEGIEWSDDLVDLDVDEELVDAVLALFERTLRQALGRGVLRGYRREDAALPVVRGRIDVAAQLRRQQGRMLPVHVVFDEHTEDITANRLLRAALWRCRHVGARSRSLVRRLAFFERVLGDVALVDFDARDLPVVPIDRLNAHYRPALMVARLILRSTSLEHRRAGQPSFAFLVDMNRAFENFVVVALREELGLDARSFPQGLPSPRLFLDEGSKIRLKPDLSWWAGGRCEFVGDVKYKRTSDSAVPNADVYQLLAYAVALGLPEGLLVYAEGEAADVAHEVRNLGKRIIVRSIDVGGSPDAIRAQVRDLAALVRSLRTPTLRSA